MRLNFTFLLFSIFFIQHISLSQAPTVQDCPGAIPICQDFYDEPDPYAYSGEGNYLDEIYFDAEPGSCYTTEANGIWYSFTAQTSGLLRFVIRPHNPLDDYDWIVFNITNGNCSDLKTEALTYFVSSNTYGGTDTSDIYIDSTGINSNYTAGTLSNCNGGGPFNGPPFNQDVSVIQGNNYLLYVSNWSASDYGYAIDFSTSTAVLYDDIPPVLKELSNDILCGESSLTVRFSENIECSGISNNLFTLTGPDGELTISSVSSNLCNAGALRDKEIQIQVNEGLIPGDYTLLLESPVTDACGNASNLGGFTFNLPATEILSVTYTDILCYGDDNGTINITATSESGHVLYSVDGGASYTNDDGSFENLAPGNYNIVVNNESDCMTEGETVTLSEPAELTMNIENVVDVDRCAGTDEGQITVSATGGTGTISYSIDGSNYSSNPVFPALSSGDYTVYARDENMCLRSADVTVGFNFENCITPPNAFTPNDDGTNDTWEIENMDLFPEATVEIYDRWGTLLSKYSGHDEGWDGRFNKNPLPADTFYYVLTIGNEKPVKGQVTIVR